MTSDKKENDQNIKITRSVLVTKSKKGYFTPEEIIKRRLEIIISILNDVPSRNGT